MKTRSYFAEAALLPDGWAEGVRLDVGADGLLAAVEAGRGPDGAERLAGPVLPGMPNLHSHAFQRAMAGLTERWTSGEDSFWTWRAVMYGFLEHLDPDEVEAIATQPSIDAPIVRDGRHPRENAAARSSARVAARLAC